ncbi:MAG: hypothetical protein J7L50_01915 [Candidatus Odinarchaeota archaeon]|nr:hypothetical protein [Candidatus Odinarchaeota archaeon]
MPFKRRREAEKEKVVRDIKVSDEVLERLDKIIKSSKYLTPEFVANQLNLRVSIVKKLLRDLEKKGVLRNHIYSRRLKVYVPAGG